jgi:hypothetical protein
MTIEKWFREVYLPPKHPDCAIEAGATRLAWGGAFNYDARVLKSGTLLAVYCLSCSQYKTTGGKGGAGKFNKIQGDILKMLGTECPRKVLVFTGKTMLAKVQAEQKAGRLPRDIECELAELPPELAAIVQKISAESAKEVTPYGF